MLNAIFITGTDTNIGKTFISSLLLKEFNALKLQTFAIKPIASGCHCTNDGSLQNEDALCLQAFSTIQQPYSIVNPIALQEPIAPHLAARKMGVQLSKLMVKKAILSSVQIEADMNLIEGVGGWAMPLNDHELFSEVIKELKIPVILVVGVKLGCLNHALLTYQNIMSMQVPFIGWIANCLVPETLAIEENISFLQQWIKQPCLGIVPYNCQSVGHIDMEVVVSFNTVVSPEEIVRIP